MKNIKQPSNLVTLNLKKGYPNLFYRQSINLLGL